MHQVRLITVCSFLAGIVWASDAVLPRAHSVAAFVALAGWMVTLATSRCGPSGQGRSLWLRLVGVSLVALVAGHWRGESALAAALNPPLRRDVHVRSGVDVPGTWTLEGTLASDGAALEYGVLLLVDVVSVERHGHRLPTRGRVALTVTGAHHGRRHETWSAGRRIRASASLRDSQFYQNPGNTNQMLARATRGVAWLGTVKSELLVDVLERGNWKDEWSASLRQHARRAVRRVVREPTQAAIVTAILIGDRAGIPADVEARLQMAGTYHVIAISGGNIAILTAILAVCWRVLALPSRARAVLSGVLVGGYGAVAQGSASVSRACLVAMICVAAQWFDVRPRGLPVLWCAALGLLAWSPLLLFDTGFQLTVAATLGLLLAAGLSPATAARGTVTAGPAAAAGRFALATLAADLAMLPTASSVFNRVTIAGVILNFVAIPLMTLTQLCGIVVVSADGLLPRAQVIAGQAADLSVRALIWTSRLVDVCPRLSWRVPPPSWTALAVYFGCWTSWVVFGPRLHGARRCALLGLACCCTAGVACGAEGCQSAPALPLPPQARGDASTSLRESSVLTFVFLDVGQGDATVVRFPSGRTWLIDTGGIPGAATFDVGARVVAPALWALGVRRIDVLAITHADPDHAGGAVSLLTDFAPREFWEGIPVAGHRLLERIHAAARVGSRREKTRGDVSVVDDVTVRVLNPAGASWARMNVRNDDSLLFSFEKGQVRVVLPGDIGTAVEREVVPFFASRAAGLTVLKLAHHGSANSTSADFIEAIRPALAVVSAGRNNRFGHPAQPVMARLRRAGVPVAGTDVLGAIALMTDGRAAQAWAWTGFAWQPVWSAVAKSI